MFDLQCESVTKRFGKFTAVDGVSFDIPSGSFFSILGPSGCGKTTLMRMIAGFEKPNSGDIQIKGKSVLGDAAEPAQRQDGVPAPGAVSDDERRREHRLRPALPGRAQGRDPAARSAPCSTGSGCPASRTSEISQLSGGQKQRIAIARCMVLEPDVLLLDEPLGALDLKLREHMKIELKQLQHRFDTTFLYITHDQSEALVMSDKVAVMNAGRFEQIGPPRDLYHAPKSGFVAGFVGDSNRWKGEVTEASRRHGEGRFGRRRECLSHLPATIAWSRRSKAEVFVRPEAIAIGAAVNGAGSAAGGETNALPAGSTVCLFNGANSRILVRTAAGELIEVNATDCRGESRDLAEATT